MRGGHSRFPRPLREIFAARSRNRTLARRLFFHTDQNAADYDLFTHKSSAL